MGTIARELALPLCPVQDPFLSTSHPVNSSRTLRAQGQLNISINPVGGRLFRLITDPLGKIISSAHSKPPDKYSCVFCACNIDMWRSTTLFEYPEDEPELVFPSLPVGPRTRRGVGINRGVGLRIITVTEAGYDASATALTSASGFSQKRKSNLNSQTLPLSAVVGAPPSGRSFRPQSPPSRPRRVRAPIMAHKKPSRYEAAHRELLDRSGSLPAEVSPENLKIQTLERATAFLHAQIQEAQEYAEQLRGCLSDRNTKPREYQCYQREKWRTDRRLSALMVLKESIQVTCHTGPQNLQYETASLPARKRANLSSFFQRGSCKAPLRFKCAATGKVLERRVLKQVSPLFLKPSAPSTRIYPLQVPHNLPPLCTRRKQPEKVINTRESALASPSTSYSVTEGTSTSGHSLKTLPDDSMGATHDGIALILSPTLRSEEEIIAEMGDITLPAYAMNLLEDLDYIHDKIPLRPESSALGRSTFSGPPSPLLISPPDWGSLRSNPSVTSPGRTATVRIPDRRLADALLSSSETQSTPRRRGRTHKVSLDPTLFNNDSKSDKVGEVVPTRHSVHVPTEEERRKPMNLLRKKSSGVLSLVSRNSGRREEAATSSPRRNITSMVRNRMSAFNKFR